VTEGAEAPRAFLFDVFGTVVDWRSSVARGLEGLLAPRGVTADWAGLADAWRGRYDPSMAPVRDGRRAYVDLDLLHGESLDAVLAEAGIAPLDPATRDAAVKLWHALDPWPDAAEGIARLGRIAPCATCSNGHVALMVGVARHGGLRWDAILGAPVARTFKPAPQVYLESAAALGCAPGTTMMVAAHNADLAAAQALGFRTAFVTRPTEHGAGQTVDLAPEGDWEIVCDDLVALAQRFGV
jgi:2-haloacid dehalogenase